MSTTTTETVLQWSLISLGYHYLGLWSFLEIDLVQWHSSLEGFIGINNGNKTKDVSYLCDPFILRRQLIDEYGLVQK